MNIQTVKNNILNTIRGKEIALEEFREARKVSTIAEDFALYTSIEFLKLNIAELRTILDDLENCTAAPEFNDNDSNKQGTENARYA